MNRNIHDIYDVIMKIIVMVYGSTFLRVIGIEKEIEKILDVEFTAVTGNKFYLDYLCLLENDTICHIEFQFPIAKTSDLVRFSNYNILAQARHQKITDTYIVNFSQDNENVKKINIGKSKSFHPDQIYLGDIDFEEKLEKINIKVNSNEKLTNEEEIILLTASLPSNCKNKLKTLKQICRLIQKEELFDESKIEFIKAITGLEVKNILTEKEKKEIKKEIKMTPQAEEVVLQAINEVNQKVLSETKIQSRNEGIKEGKKEGKKEGIKEGKKEGKKEGIKEGKKEGIKEVAKNLKETMTPEEISKYTGLTIEKIKQL